METLYTWREVEVGDAARKYLGEDAGYYETTYGMDADEEGGLEGDEE